MSTGIGFETPSWSEDNEMHTYREEAAARR
jgi:hypothetical protein